MYPAEAVLFFAQPRVLKSIISTRHVLLELVEGFNQQCDVDENSSATE